MTITVANKKVLVDRKMVRPLKNYYLSFVGRGYVRCTPKGWRNRGKGVYLHHLVLNHKSNTKVVVDHINRDIHDNRQQNLRLVDRTQNNLNRTGVKNYSKHTKVGWVVEFCRYGKKYRKWFLTMEQAKEFASLPKPAKKRS